MANQTKPKERVLLTAWGGVAGFPKQPFSAPSSLGEVIFHLSQGLPIEALGHLVGSSLRWLGKGGAGLAPRGLTHTAVGQAWSSHAWEGMTQECPSCPCWAHIPCPVPALQMQCLLFNWGWRDGIIWSSMSPQQVASEQPGPRDGPRAGRAKTHRAHKEMDMALESLPPAG